jgi:hypothetical protein
VPANAQQNWKSYNNFRSGDLSANDGAAAPDLRVVAPMECLNKCSGPEMAEIWVQLGNVGAAPLTAGADIEVYTTVLGVESLSQTVPFAQVLQPGEFAAAILIEVSTADLEKVRIVAKPKEAECIVDPADEMVVEAPFCMIPG